MPPPKPALRDQIDRLFVQSSISRKCAGDRLLRRGKAWRIDNHKVKVFAAGFRSGQRGKGVLGEKLVVCKR